MKTLTLLLGACWVSTLACAGEITLPAFYKSNYEASRRDPLISAEAATTLQGGPAINANQIAAGGALQSLLANIARDLRARLVVGGVASYPGGRGRAVISGVEVSAGDRFVVPIASELNSKLQGVLRTYSGSARRLALDERNDALELVVGAITPGGVALNLPGFQTPVCFLNYDRQLRLEPRRIPGPAAK